MEASYLQRIHVEYMDLDTFPQYEIFEPFANLEIKEGFSRNK